jgi:uncharacterized membrane protein YeaQ/YmgE (transglycosylase-associated protein family)
VTTNLSLILHAVVVVALIGAYVSMTVLNHDGGPILDVLLGYLGASSVAHSAAAVVK